MLTLKNCKIINSSERHPNHISTGIGSSRALLHHVKLSTNETVLIYLQVSGLIIEIVAIAQIMSGRPLEFFTHQFFYDAKN